MDETTIIGIDCATEDLKVGLSLGFARGDRCVVQCAVACSKGLEIAEEAAGWLKGSMRGLIALDAPLGWPRPLCKALTEHRAGDPFQDTAHQLFRRATDRFIKKRIGKLPLDVGADKIARTAVSALTLLSKIRQRTGWSIPLAWEPSYSDRVAAIEVYPAATLVARRLPDRNYKEKGKIAARQTIITGLERMMQLPQDRTAMEVSADALDAAICVLAGFDFLRGDACKPEDAELARREGWIWVRPSGRNKGDGIDCG